MGVSQWCSRGVRALSSSCFLTIAYLVREGYTHAWTGIAYPVIAAMFSYVYFDGTVQSSLPLHPLFRHPWMGRLWLRLAYGVVKLFFRLCCQVHIEGSEHIPSQGGVVLVSNHIS